MNKKENLSSEFGVHIQDVESRLEKGLGLPIVYLRSRCPAAPVEKLENIEISS